MLMQVQLFCTGTWYCLFLRRNELLCYCLWPCYCVHLQLHQLCSNHRLISDFFLPPLDHPFVVRSYAVDRIGFFEPYRLHFTYFETLYTMSLCSVSAIKIFVRLVVFLRNVSVGSGISMNYLLSPF